METTRNWKLRYSIILGYAVPVAALIVSAATTVVNISTVNQRSKDLVSFYEVKSLFSDLAYHVQMNSRLVRGYLLEKNSTSLENYEKSRDALNQTFSKVMALPSNGQDEQTLKKLNVLMSQVSDLENNLIRLVNENKPQEAVETWKKDDARTLLGEITDIIEQIQHQEDQKVDAATKQQQESLTTLKLAILLTSGISLLLSILIGAWVINRTARQMHESASAIAVSTTEIATTLEQQERAALQQATSVNQTTTTMDELSASSRQSAKQAEASAAGAQQVLLLIDSHSQDSQANQSSLREKVSDIATQILHLSEQTNQIGSISILVSDLANQTNMLALNAAVEAVRAGEHGRGFAVVASEIRKLADQSKKSAEKINALVVDIQKSTNSTVMVTDEGSKTVEKIVDAVKTITLNSQQISLTSNQQAVAVQQVVEAMNSLNIAARESASGITQIKVGTQRLNESAQELKAIV